MHQCMPSPPCMLREGRACRACHHPPACLSPLLLRRGHLIYSPQAPPPFLPPSPFRRGAAFGVAGVVKGLGIMAMKNYGIMDALKVERSLNPKPRKP